MNGWQDVLKLLLTIVAVFVVILGLQKWMSPKMGGIGCD
ncbi:hypothetical protein MNBD_DELTA03-1341 [hydrothermal vent metagenome]|jgi:hypothetical protein|uniref:Uncharacterized protein n=1 Tax=hydrothermal vent metagenome TaxID=652676 RepID=A0A3B0WDP9_9ZZZZ